MFIHPLYIVFNVGYHYKHSFQYIITNVITHMYHITNVNDLHM
jgi:hypothetical protein